MHNNYYFLRQLSKSLESKISGTVISETFSQNKNELIIRFETHTKPFFIRASLEPHFSCLTFPQEFHRARKNSVDLFDEIIGRRVTSIIQFQNERSFALKLSDGITLVFKMHGNRSNILLFKDELITDVFRNNIEADKQITLESLDRKIDFSETAFRSNITDLKKLYFTFGKVVWKYLEDQNFDALSIDEKWSMLQALLIKLNDPEYFILTEGQNTILSLIDPGKNSKSFSEPIVAINEFYHTFIQSLSFHREKETILADSRAKLRGGQSYLVKTQNKLDEIERDTSYKMWADLIMANLNNIKTGDKKIVLSDFVTGHPVEIKLKPEVSPQKNAELFYKKSKNQHIEIQHLKKAIAEKTKEVTKLTEHIASLEAITDLKEFRNQPGSGKSKEKKEKQKEILPYFEFEFQGFRIWVGRNAQANDTLTLKHTYKEDLWLHAKDVAGSHVVIKHQSGKKFPKNVIEYAAGLAASNSKRKNESLCPVIVTSKKYVRKRKGDPAGAVVVDREEVILVSPIGVNR